ncbi:gp105 [Bacillus phage G]|uniref:Gp105 n=1 Tax=Bacillus phage G TaxID=2884420 RepID=G3MBG7_9CAUD|nr:gp105 [Bacillus phage G]AEO93367.1 gp105 [Bacillus phage G]
MTKGEMSNRDKVTILRNAAIKSSVRKNIEQRDLESILEVEVCFQIVKTGEYVSLVENRDEAVTIVRFKVDEELSLIEHMIKGLDFKELAGKREYEIIYV